MTHALIIGGGICGAATALALNKAGITSTIYEAHASPAYQTGAFLMLMRNGLDALKAIDAHAAVADVSFATPHIEHIDHAGTPVDLAPIGGEGEPPCTVTRSALLQALHEQVIKRGGRIEYGKHLAEATTAGRTVVARFADGSHAEADLLVGADGIHSPTRRHINTANPSPRYTGQNIIYGHTDDPAAPAAAPGTFRMVHGSQAFFGYTTSPEGRTFWFCRFPGTRYTSAEQQAAEPGQWRRTALEYAEADRTEAAAIIGAADDSATATSIFDLPSIPCWHNGAMVLAGDAAHVSSPSAAQGASVAVEDAVILAKCLRDLPDPATAFAAYTQLRRSRAERLVAFSARQAEHQSDMIGEARDARDWLYAHHIDWHSTIENTS
ncbi:FAD-dependent monooxygenase [Streptomyces sp. RB6PN25]|uniref:FAD-dependent monooxygenase n=1 Tax=Streptomyces humicola TaxID=2953240 RepID=A0ABT1PSV1_9ACTN|nr:NAD(P)/FAD-dependent oxidoreductase [Streptomyces humicola]MCQ4080747.1 FAD-dependent monooxygenase [Streptomyces humicola]